MAKLHNFLIDSGKERCDSPTEEDEWSMAVNGAVSFSVRRGCAIPLQLMDGGKHFDEDPNHQRRTDRRSNSSELPREQMFTSICERRLTRPSARTR